MKSHLTRRVLRQLCYNALFRDSRASLISLTPQCLHLQRLPLARLKPTVLHQKRTFFNFLRKKRKQKSANYEPGYEVLLDLSEKLKTEVRPPPAQDVQDAFKKYVDFRWHIDRRPEDIQMRHLKTAFNYLREEASKGEWRHDISSEDITKALSIIAKPASEGQERQIYVDFSRILFTQSRTRYLAADEGPEAASEQKQRFQRDALLYIRILAVNGQALEAQHLAEQYSDDDLVEMRHSVGPITQGLVQEGRDQELEQIMQALQKRKVSVDYDKLRSDIIQQYALIKKDLNKAREWYYRSVNAGQQPNFHTRRVVLALCIQRDNFEFGDEIVKHATRETCDDKLFLDLTLRWAATKGRGVDEIQRMMEALKRRHKDSPHLQPDMNTINALARLAATKFNDPYTAERYIALGEKMGFEPDAKTHLVQLEYRIKNNDLSGAMVSYSALRNLEPPDQHSEQLNRLIVAFCEQRSQNYDAIMSLVEDLNEKKAPFSPETVAALAKLHLQRTEMEDLEDLLNTYAPSFGTADRELVCVTLIDHILDPETGKMRAWDTWNLARRVFPETPVEVRSEIMKSFFHRSRPDMATHVFGQMRHSQLREQRPTIETYAACFEGIARFADTENLENVHNWLKLDNEVEPNTKIYNALMIGYTGCELSSRALDFWDDIVHSREGPTYSSIQIALRACERAPFGDRKARKIWNRLEGSEIEITKEIYAAYLGALAGHNLFDECVSMCKNAAKAGFAVDALLLGTFYNASLGETNRQKVKEWARDTYPEAYEALLKCGQYEIKRPEPGEVAPGEGYQGLIEREIYFNIGHLGRDAKP